MTDAEFTALIGQVFPLSLNDLPAALDSLAAAGYNARVVGEPGDLALVIEEREEKCQVIP